LNLAAGELLITLQVPVAVGTRKLEFAHNLHFKARRKNASTAQVAQTAKCPECATASAHNHSR
jgi:hypothetical protein